jgi:hypothetical protein
VKVWKYENVNRCRSAEVDGWMDVVWECASVEMWEYGNMKMWKCGWVWNCGNMRV